MFTPNQLKQIMPDAGDRLGVFYAPLLVYMSQYDITSLERMAMFLATIAHESGQLRYTAELWGPTDAQKRYERPGQKAEALGNTQVGDGKRFCGRGLIQITGRANYAALSKALGVDFVSTPSLLREPAYATHSACWWWAEHGCNNAADKADFRAATLIVNGGYNGWEDRQQFYTRAKSVLSKPDFGNVVSGVSSVGV